MSNRIFALVAAGLLLAGVIAVVAFSRGWIGNDAIATRSDSGATEPASAANSAPTKPVAKTRSLSDALGIPESEITNIGGISRPVRDVGKKTDSAKPARNPLPVAGKLPPLKGNENRQVAGLFKELSDPNGPREAGSAMFLPEEFDKERYFDNPEEFLEKIRPGRVFRPANPGPGVTPIAAKSPRLTSLLQGERAILKVKSAPNSPVTFYIPGGGEFSNRLKTISVAANQDGIAEAVYTAVSGVSSNIEILASSPLHSGIAKFVVKVVLPGD